MNERRRTQAERRAETRAAVLESACRLFGSRGYAATSLEEIAAGCGVTIRPIYHYFGNKKQLFAAVTERMEEQIVESIQASAESASGDPILSGWRAFLDRCRDPGLRRIVLVDSPNVLGRDRWTDSAVTRAAAGRLRAGRGEAGDVRGRLVARMLMGAFAEAALAIAESDDPERWSREADEVVRRLVGAVAEMEDGR
jgi:AcrR family transcriptional regulator